MGLSLSEMGQINGDSSLVSVEPEGSYKQLFLPFRCLCSRKDVSLQSYILLSKNQNSFTCALSLPMLIMCFVEMDLVQIQCKDVLLEESDVGKALVEYVNQFIIEVLVVGSSSKGGFLRCVLSFSFSYAVNFPT